MQTGTGKGGYAKSSGSISKGSKHCTMLLLVILRPPTLSPSQLKQSLLAIHMPMLVHGGEDVQQWLIEVGGTPFSFWSHHGLYLCLCCWLAAQSHTCALCVCGFVLCIDSVQRYFRPPETSQLHLR